MMIIEKILKGLRAYSIILVIPVVMTIGFVLFCGIFNMQCNYELIEGVVAIWRGFWYDGTFVGIVAWRLHLGLFWCLVLVLYINELYESLGQ